MNGTRIQEFLTQEVEAMLCVYNQFQTLVPNEKQKAAAHKGEDGRYIECLLKELLRKFLPEDLEVFSGFIVRPAVKTGENNRQRETEKDRQ